MDRAFGARFGAGLSSGRVEDLRLVTGQGRYAANLPGDLHAAFVRSPYSHARILGIDLSEALSMPGVRLVLTGRDLSEHGVRPLPFAKVLQREDGAPMASPARWPLAVEEVHYVGDPVAVVVADDAAKARDAAEAVQVNYEELACVVDLETAVEMGAVRASLELRDNLAADFRLGDAVEVDAAIAAAPHVTRLRVVNNRVIVNPMELRSAVASYDPDEGFVWNGATQTPHLSQAILAEVLGVGEESVRVVVGDMGGAFGARIVPDPEDAALLCAARQLRRSVKWQSDRSEQFLSDTHARDHLTECTLATDNQGRILAARFDVLANMGAYLSYFGANIATHTGNRVATGVYDIPLLHVNVKVVLTNTVPTGPYRGAGRPEAIHRLERVLDVAASELGIDPVEIRRRNLVRPDSMPYTAASGATYDSGDFGALMDRALVLSDSQGVTGRREDARRRGMLFGRGVACHIDTTSSMVPSETVEVAFTRNGSVEIYCGVQAMGQGLETTFSQMASIRLGVPLDAVQVFQGDTSVVATKGQGSYGSRSLYIAGSALALALDRLADEARHALGEHLGVAPEQIGESAGLFVIAGQQPISLSEAMGMIGNSRLSATASFETVNCYPSGCYICEVEIDPETGVVQVTRFVAVDDVGTVMHPTIVHGQTRGGIVQGIGQALWEACRYDDAGQLSTGSLMDYALPRASDLPEIIVDFLPTRSPTNPLGAKGGGESGTIGAPPAVVNAVVDALQPYGVTHLDMPISPQAIVAIMLEKMNKCCMQIPEAGFDGLQRRHETVINPTKQGEPTR